jgi:RNA polymerase sigma factor (sigma-70 family)
MADTNATVTIRLPRPERYIKTGAAQEEPIYESDDSQKAESFSIYWRGAAKSQPQWWKPLTWQHTGLLIDFCPRLLPALVRALITQLSLPDACVSITEEAVGIPVFVLRRAFQSACLELVVDDLDERAEELTYCDLSFLISVAAYAGSDRESFREHVFPQMLQLYGCSYHHSRPLHSIHWFLVLALSQARDERLLNFLFTKVLPSHDRSFAEGRAAAINIIKAVCPLSSLGRDCFIRLLFDCLRHENDESDPPEPGPAVRMAVIRALADWSERADEIVSELSAFIERDAMAEGHLVGPALFCLRGYGVDTTPYLPQLLSSSSYKRHKQAVEEFCGAWDELPDVGPAFRELLQDTLDFHVSAAFLPDEPLVIRPPKVLIAECKFFAWADTDARFYPGTAPQAEGTGETDPQIASLLRDLQLCAVDGLDGVIPYLIDWLDCKHMPPDTRSGLLLGYRRLDTELDTIIDPATRALKHAFIDYQTDPLKTPRDIFLLLHESTFMEHLRASARKLLRASPPVCEVEDLVQAALTILLKWVRKKGFKVRGPDHRAFVTWLKNIRKNLLAEAYKEIIRGLPRDDRGNLLDATYRQMTRGLPIDDVEAYTEMNRGLPIDEKDDPPQRSGPRGRRNRAARFYNCEHTTESMDARLKERLTERQCQIVMLKFAGYTDEEIAQQLGCSRWLVYKERMCARRSFLR